jgi:hypothetical protein
LILGEELSLLARFAAMEEMKSVPDRSNLQAVRMKIDLLGFANFLLD